MCIEGFRMEEACGRIAGPLPPSLGTGTPGIGVAGVRGVPADSCSYPCREQSAQSAQSCPAGSGLIDSVPDAARGERTPPDLSPRGRDHDADLSSPPAHAAGVLADMEPADTANRHPADGHPVDGHPADGHPVDGNPVVGHPGNGHPVDVPLVGRQPTPETIAARVRLVQKLAARTAAAKKTASSTVSAHELDLLARVTAQFSELLHRLGDALETAQRSHYYSVLSRTTQPAHLVAFVAVALVAATLFPRSAESTTATSGARGAAPSQPSPWTYLAYVVAFAAHFGSQFWMTFVSGLSLFFSLPRHHFGAVQKVLFPLYFAINAALSLVTLSTFVRLQPPASRWDAEVMVQVGGMVLCFLLELLVRLYLTPPLLHLITAKTEMEKTVEGVGEEVGRYDLGPLTQCPHYVRIHRAFRKVHVTIAMANIAAMACTALHAHYLAGKICV